MEKDKTTSTLVDRYEHEALQKAKDYYQGQKTLLTDELNFEKRANEKLSSENKVLREALEGMVFDYGNDTTGSVEEAKNALKNTTK